MDRRDGANVLVYESHDVGPHLSPCGPATGHVPNALWVATQAGPFENRLYALPHHIPSQVTMFAGCQPRANGALGLTHTQLPLDLSCNRT